MHHNVRLELFDLRPLRRPVDSLPEDPLRLRDAHVMVPGEQVIETMQRSETAGQTALERLFPGFVHLFEEGGVRVDIVAQRSKDILQ